MQHTVAMMVTWMVSKTVAVAVVVVVALAGHIHGLRDQEIWFSFQGPQERVKCNGFLPRQLCKDGCLSCTKLSVQAL